MKTIIAINQVARIDATATTSLRDLLPLVNRKMTKNARSGGSGSVTISWPLRGMIGTVTPASRASSGDQTPAALTTAGAVNRPMCVRAPTT